MVDVHCHLDMFPDPIKIIQKYERMGITAISNTNLPSHFNEAFKRSRSFKRIRFALGFHPLLVGSNENEILNFKKFCAYTSYIGEIGLDFSKDGINTKNRQLAVFNEILNITKDKDKIHFIHSRKAEAQTLVLLKKYRIKKAVFHWYTGSLKVLEEIIDSGYYISINPAMTKTKNGRLIIENIPFEKIMTETDSPFALSKGKEISINDIYDVYKILSNIHSLSEESIEQAIDRNFLTFVQNA